MQNQNNILSGNRTEIHGKKEGFNLNTYFVKKWNLREKHRQASQKSIAKESKKWQFVNCCLLTIDEKVQVKPNEVFGILKASLNDSLDKIVSIGQFGSSKNWTIQFRDTASYEMNQGKEIIILNEKHSLKDANLIEKKEKIKPDNQYTMTVFVRIHWLPSGFKTKITEFLREEARFLTVMVVKSETWEEGKSSIENGVYSVKVRYDIDDHDNFLNFAGYHRVDGLGTLIQINGAGSKCLQCSKWGHIRKECPNNYKKCTTCHKTGHEAGNCWSSQAKNNNNNNDELISDMDLDSLVKDQKDQEEEEVEFLGEEKSLSNSTNNQFKMPTQDSNYTLEFKKEKLNQFSDNQQGSTNSVVTKTMAPPPLKLNVQSERFRKTSSDTSNPPTPTFSAATFAKIKNSSSKSSKSTPKFTKPKHMSKEDWEIELKRLKREDKSKEEITDFNNMNAAALKASKQIKRANSTSNVSDHKKLLGAVFHDDSQD